jgi:AcrR family transcriptional regulator
VDAAALLFVRDGYAATPLKAIAAEAGVSVQSVHLAGPKSSLLLAAFERTFAGDEGRQPLADRPIMIDIFSEKDPAVLLQRYVAFLADANQRSAGISRALASAADADPAARAAADDLEARRRAEMSNAALFIADRGLIDVGDAPLAADVIGYLTSTQTFLYFVEDSGWSLERYRTWLTTALLRLVLNGTP